MFSKSILTLCGVALLAVGQSASAVTITTLDYSQGWGNFDTRTGGTAAITELGGRQALVISTDSTIAGSGQAKASVFGVDISGLGKVSELTSLSFDWYRDSASSDTNTRQLPNLRLYIQNPDSSIVQLNWEWAENTAAAAVEDTWVTQDLLNGSENLFWNYSNSHNFFNASTVTDGSVPGTPNNYRQTYGFWAGGGYVTDFSGDSVVIDNDALILGVLVQMGSGINGYYLGGVDNISLGFTPGTTGQEQVTTFEFGIDAVSAPVPEPATAAMGVMGLAGLVLASRRRRA